MGQSIVTDRYSSLRCKFVVDNDHLSRNSREKVEKDHRDTGFRPRLVLAQVTKNKRLAPLKVEAPGIEPG